MLAKTFFLCVGLLAENYVLDRMWCLLSGFKGIRFADLASLVKPKSLQCGTSHLVHCVACFGVIF